MRGKHLNKFFCYLHSLSVSDYVLASGRDSALLLCLEGCKDLRAKTSLLKISCGWRAASSKQARPGHISCSVSSWEEFGWHHHIQVSSRCPLWSPSLASLCRWLRTKRWVSQFRACSCFPSAVTNNDCKNLRLTCNGRSSSWELCSRTRGNFSEADNVEN